MNRRKNSFGLRRKRAERSRKQLNNSVFAPVWVAVTPSGRAFFQRFILCLPSLEIPTMSRPLLLIQSSDTMRWTFSIIFGAIAVFGCPLRRSSFVLVQSRLTEPSFSQLKTKGHTLTGLNPVLTWILSTTHIQIAAHIIWKTVGVMRNRDKIRK